MSSPRLRKGSDFDHTIGRELQAWAGRQQPPADLRERILAGASARERKRRRLFALHTPLAFRKIRTWLHSGPARRKPQLPYTELSQWLFNQAMWHNLGNDRRAVRFVC